MDGKLAAKTRFFKVMMPGYHQKMNFPPVFCKMLKGVKSKQAIVRSCKGIWKMNVCKTSEGLMCFKEGWSDFVHHHNLSIGDFIVFEWTSDLHFNAFVFDPSACEKDFRVDVKKELESAPQGVSTFNDHPRNTKREPVTELGVSYNCMNPNFILTMASCHARKYGRPSIPVEFARSHDFFQKTSLILRDPCRKTWPVKLSFQESRTTFSCRMGKGWHKFCVSNKIKDGDVCVFELSCRSPRSSPTAEMDVQIFPVPI